MDCTPSFGYNCSCAHTAHIACKESPVNNSTLTQSRKCLLVVALLAVASAVVSSQGAQYAKNKALMIAAMRGTLADVEGELNAGADVNARDEGGMTPLIYAAGFNNDVRVTEALIAAGAQVNARGPAGMCPLMWAAQNNTKADVVKALLEAGADPSVKDFAGRRAVDILEDRAGEEGFGGSDEWQQMLELLR